MTQKKILIVEDEFNTRFAIDFALAKAGHETVQAQNGTEALTLMQESVTGKKPFDLVVTDIQMPGMNGLELIDAMRRANSFLPVLVITGFGDKKMLVELLRRGCADYLDKPFSPDDLIAAVGRVLKKCEQERLSAANLHDKLIRADKLCTLSEIAPCIVHEINNPAQVILGCAELMLANTGIDSVTRKMASSIYEACQSVVKLNREILEITRPQDMHHACFSPEQPLEKAISFLAGAGILKGFTVQREYEAAALQIRGDLMQLHQVFLNLVMNAYYAMQDSSCKTLSLAIRHDRQTGMIAISLKDTGCGIAEENLGRIFESFFTTRGAHGGTGLGLAVVKNIVERHGGAIEVASRPGAGSVFTVRLPATRGGDSAEDSGHSA